MADVEPSAQIGDAGLDPELVRHDVMAVITSTATGCAMPQRATVGHLLIHTPFGGPAAANRHAADRSGSVPASAVVGGSSLRRWRRLSLVSWECRPWSCADSRAPAASTRSDTSLTTAGHE